jgi:hypothetical protein
MNVKGNMYVNGAGSYVASAGTTTFNGTGTQYIGGDGSAATFFDLTVNKSSGDIVLLRNINVAGDDAVDPALTLTNGDIDLNGDRTIFFD